jgi:hypothetical protein
MPAHLFMIVLSPALTDMIRPVKLIRSNPVDRVFMHDSSYQFN